MAAARVFPLAACLAGYLCCALAPAARGAPAGPVADLERAMTSFRAGDYAAAAKRFDGLAARLPRVRDYVLYYGGESEFFAGRPRVAVSRWQELERDKSSRFATVATYRIADGQWAAGDRQDAVVTYRRALGTSAEGERPSPKLERTRQNAFVGGGGLLIDAAVGRFRIALALAETRTGGAPDAEARARAARAFRALYLEFPAHPFADEARRRAEALAPGSTPDAGASDAPRPDLPPAERLVRAETLADARRFEAAVAELESLPATLPAPLGAERDFLLGMTVFKMRNDYARAAKHLLAAEPGLTGDKRASAAFHGTRALSRVHRDDEAIVGYRRVVASYGSSRYAPEASFLVGWLDFNRNRWKEALPGFEETIRRYPRSEFAADAAWFTVLGHVLLGDGKSALAALERMTRIVPSARTGELARRVAYYRARAELLIGDKAAARTALVEVAQKAPFSYYGLLARARLRQLGAPLPLSLPPYTGKLAAVTAVDDQLLARCDQLHAAGLSHGAAIELQRGEQAFTARRGRDRALPLLFDRYARYGNGGFRRAYQLAEAYGEAALASAPKGAARVYWQAAYPRAFAALVDAASPLEDNPPHFLHSIIRKESAYLPSEVSYADARGLVQLLPERAAELAREIDRDFADDELYVPATAIRLGARYTGGLVRKFHGNIAPAAGAYNAGARAVTRWCDRNGARPLDDFVELVTFEDTREYIRRVLPIYARYHYLYEGKPWEPALGPPGCRYRDGHPEN